MNPVFGAAVNSTVARFDGGTLGGCVTYATITTRVPGLTGELEGRIVRDPEYSSVPAGEPPVGTAKLDG